MDVRVLRGESLQREAYARRRQELWREMSSGEVSNTTFLADEVRRLTLILNGNHGDTKSYMNADGGMYEQKRRDRIALEDDLGVHECNRTKVGTLRRVTPQLRRVVAVARAA